MQKYFYFFAPNSKDALVILLSIGSTIENGYRNCGTHAQVFSQTLAQGNSKNEITKKQKEKVRREARVCKVVKKEVMMAYHYLIKIQ